MIWSNTLQVLEMHNERLIKTSSTIADQFASSIGRLIVERDIATLQERAGILLKHSEVSYIVIENRDHRKILTIGSIPPEAFVKLIPMKNMDKVPIFIGDVFLGDQDKTFIFKKNVVFGNKVRGFLQIGFSSGIVEKFTKEVFERSVMIALIGVVLSIAIALFIGRVLSKNLETLTTGVRRIARGEKNIDLFIPGNDEISVLSSAIGKMISEREKAEKTILHQANFDSLTNLPNRTVFFDRLQMAQLNAERDNKMVAVHFVDLDFFKDINDTEGHSTGDVLLQMVATRLSGSVRRVDTVARLGGDEFGIIQTAVGHVNDAELLAEKVLATMRSSFSIGLKQFFISASIGITVYPMDDTSPEELLRNADIAMYEAKDEGRNRYEFYSSIMSETVKSRNVIEQELHGALERNELTIHYQPKITCKDKRITGVEALVRWNHPTLGLVMPDAFIPAAERSGMIVPLGEWVLRKACLESKSWQDAGLPPIDVAVNLSAIQFKQEDLLDMVKAVLKETKLDPCYLELEITESILMQEARSSINILDKLDSINELGVKIALDDFGTGYSSLAYLRKFPLFRVKIDQSFIRDVSTNSDDAAIVTAIITLGQTLNMKITAEGIEEQDQFDFLSERNCDEIQGFYYSRALPEGELKKLLRKNAGMPDTPGGQGSVSITRKP
ncbi:MAG TPA: EAL domain-containing protein [Alphaproteobacteria bacterium]|nr:EAL domain-containing protein [Alphaproteobacteria bacterium]